MGGRGELSGSPGQRPRHGTPVFEYDPSKSRANRAKHGIDFERAQRLWRDRLGFDYSVRYPSETRFLRLARLGNRIYAAFWTPRGDAVRLISVRLATQREVRQYYERNRR